MKVGVKDVPLSLPKVPAARLVGHDGPIQAVMFSGENYPSFFILCIASVELAPLPSLQHTIVSLECTVRPMMTFTSRLDRSVEISSDFSS